MIASVRDIAAAYEEGRWHNQRFIKTGSSQAGDGVWQDWAFAAGQPAYDARIGNAGEFTPIVAVRNDAVYFPPIPAGMERKLAGMSYRATPSGADQLTCDMQVYDLVGYYPLIDGDSTDPQTMDNTATLPRYTDGDGVMAILVNHVAPAIAQAVFTINYVDHAGADHTMTGITTTSGINKAAWTISGTVTGPLFLPLGSGSRGVRSITDITFTTSPGGLWCIYLVKPLIVAHNRPLPITGATGGVMSLKCLCADDSFRLPTVPDGAHIGFFFMPNGTSRTDSFFGSFVFLWG